MSTEQKNKAEKFINDELASLERMIVATPESRENLDAFANASTRGNGYLCAQMGVQFGYKIALLELKEILNS